MTISPERAVTSDRRATFVSLFSAALRGEPCHVLGLTPRPHQLPLPGWAGPADAGDRHLLSHCLGPTLDIGCGPGRMAQHLRDRGHRVLGIDLVPEAVARTRSRGASAAVCDVFDPVPGEGRWATALLADGNIGIGGDPVRLLRRVRDLLTPSGRAVVDLSPPGAGLRTVELSLECAGERSAPFRWSLVGPEALPELARLTRMHVGLVDEYAGRWFAVLGKAD